ncbi:MAG: WD40 repeat domain-containing protein [Pirellulaceae bacterium]
MSIKVVCGCGFFTLLPSEWEGKRVNCKCGRTFIVGATGSLVDPPAANDAAASLLPPSLDPTRRPAEASSMPAAPLPLDASRPIDPATQRVDGRPRERRPQRSLRQIVLAVTLLLLAIASTSVLLLVLRDHDWSMIALLRASPRQDVTPPSAPSLIPSSPPGSVNSQDPRPAGNESSPVTSVEADMEARTGAGTRLANLTALVAEDGLLLTGLFGDGYERLQLSETQQESIDGPVLRLKQNEQGLKDKSLTLEQWYAETRKTGEELLSVLTDAQRQQLQVMLERKELARLHLVEYSARIRPELAVAQMPWSVPSEGRSFRAIAKSSWTATGPDRASRTSEPTGWFATYSTAVAADARCQVTVWDLANDAQVGGFAIPAPGADDVNILSRDGRHWMLVRSDGNGAQSVEVWSTEEGRLVGSQEIPSIGGAACVPRDCVAHQVVGVAGTGFWTWDFITGDTRVREFPDSQPDAAPGVCLSAEGQYLAVAHVHGSAVPPEEFSFVEVCLYRLETGELLGNQVFHENYRRSTITAIAFSNDGRELALLWDWDPPAPERRLVHMNAANGKILKTVAGLPPADQGYAHRHQLPDRDLFWLAENSGWVVNLQHVVDAETGAVLDLALPVPNDDRSGEGLASAQVVEAVPAGDGRLLLVVAEPAGHPDEPARMRTRFVELPKLGPFQ